ncbi:pyridoxamine 5'-phosphate oxidase family protein [Marinobacter sp. M1N3S26]|uniref:pyridoxamine 5'-phosphate oxidase family protein n=1 Tax=Marinobacter sp. M1N3S26 TaxID=3382299 RepID=UPI00387AD7C3
MAKQFEELLPEHTDFINAQHLFFVGSAGAEGFVNVSPKGMDSLRVLGSNRLVWLNLTGSGNETAAHVLENGRMTIMFCSFDKQPLILRVYGRADVIHPRDDGWDDLVDHFPDYLGTRQVFDLGIELVQTSCGFGVPYYDFRGERDTLTNWASKKGEDGLQAYWTEKNQLSLDGKTTGIR